MVKKKVSKCISCGRLVEWENWAAGPVCYPCYWAAKFYYENGYKEFAEVPADFARMLGEFFSQHGYLWPDDIIKAIETKPFAKMKSTAFWWTPKYNCLGVDGIRDPNAPCERFYRGTPERSFQTCDTDGHYLCQECVCRKPANVRQAKLL